MQLQLFLNIKNKMLWLLSINNFVALSFVAGRLTINNRYMQHKFKLKFSALLKGYDLKYAENSKKNLRKHATDLIYRSICRNSYS